MGHKSGQKFKPCSPFDSRDSLYRAPLAYPAVHVTVVSRPRILESRFARPVAPEIHFPDLVFPFGETEIFEGDRYFSHPAEFGYSSGAFENKIVRAIFFSIGG